MVLGAPLGGNIPICLVKMNFKYNCLAMSIYLSNKYMSCLPQPNPRQVLLLPLFQYFEEIFNENNCRSSC